MNLEKINELTAQDMAGVNAAILEQLEFRRPTDQSVRLLHRQRRR